MAGCSDDSEGTSPDSGTTDAALVDSAAGDTGTQKDGTKQDGTTADQSKADSGAQDSSQKDSAKTGQFYLFKAKTDCSGKATKVTKVSNKQGYQMDMKLFSDDNKALVYGTSTSSATQFDLRVSAVDGSGTKVLDATVQYKHVVAVY